GSTTVSLTGTGAGSTFTLTPNPVNFGGININTTKSQTVTIKNSGTISFTIGAVSFTGAQASAFTVGANPCTGTVLAAGRTCNVTVNFRPTQRINYAANVVVAGDATSLPATVSAGMTGQGK